MGPGPWQQARITAGRQETPRTRSLRLELSRWTPHLPGQHYDVRLTAPDGYQAQRSYSVASSPAEEGVIELTVDRLADGEISPYLVDVAEVGETLELRGPIGLYFVWRGESPLLLIGGGSGVVPLMAMLRHRRLTAPDVPLRLVYSARSPDDLIYPGELGDETTVTFTRSWPADWRGATGRLTASLLAASAFSSGPALICGSHAFVEAVASRLPELGYAPERILTERFGPSPG